MDLLKDLKHHPHFHMEDEWVVAKRIKEFHQNRDLYFGAQSENNVVHNGTLRNELEFTLQGEQNEYPKLDESYITCDFRAVATDNANNALQSFLDVGGISNFVDEIEIKLGNETLEYIREYAFINSALSIMTDNVDTDYLKMIMSADSIQDYDEIHSRTQQFRYVNLTDDLKTSSLTGTDLDLGGGNTISAIENINVGDLIHIIADNALGDRIVHSSVVASITDATNIVLENEYIVNFVGGEILAVYKAELNKELSARAKVMNQSEGNVRLTMRLRAQSLKSLGILPLPIMKEKLRIIIRFKDPRYGIVLRNSAQNAVDNKFGYMLSNVRMIVPMLEIPYDIMEKHRRELFSNGLVFKYKTFAYLGANQDLGIIDRSVRNVNLQYKSRHKSARYFMFAITDNTLSNSITTNGQSFACHSTFYKNFLERYRLQVGNTNYPYYNYVGCDNIFSADVLEMLKLSTGIKLKNSLRFNSYQWFDNDSDKFVGFVPLAKSNTHLHGADLSEKYINLNLQFSGTPANLTNDMKIHCWVCVDNILALKQDKGNNEIILIS